jgi:hypothetical protein
VDEPGRATHSGAARRWQSAALLLLLACAQPMRAQEKPAPAVPAADDAAKPAAKPDDKPAANDPAAVALLQKAAAAQLQDAAAPAPTEKPAPLALFARATLRYTKDDGTEIAVEAERRFLAPDRIWTHAISSYDKAETINGYDGKRPWLWSKKGGLRWLDEPGGEADLKQLRLDVELTEMLASAFQLSRLIPRLSAIARLPDANLPAIVKDGAPVLVVAGDVDVVRGGVTKGARVELYLEPAQLHLVGARVVVAGEKPLQVWLSKHERVGGLDMPHKITLHVDDAKEPTQTLFVELLSVAPKLVDADFAPPAK